MRLLIIAVVLAAILLPVPARAASKPPLVGAPEAIVVDGWTGRVLYARNANVPRYPASTVKIMTALVILQHHIGLKRIVTVSPYAASYQGSTANLFAGEKLSVWNLLHGMMLPSGNDAAVALSELLAPSPERFAVLMNREARRLRMWRTHYLTPNGFDTPGQVSTAHDLAIVARTAMQWRIFARIVNARVWTARSPTGQLLQTWTNLNQLLWRSRSIDGIKTGTTAGAGACLVSSAKRNGRWVIEVNMGSSEQSRFPDGVALLNYGLPLASVLPSTR